MSENAEINRKPMPDCSPELTFSSNFPIRMKQSSANSTPFRKSIRINPSISKSDQKVEPVNLIKQKLTTLINLNPIKPKINREKLINSSLRKSLNCEYNKNTTIHKNENLSSERRIVRSVLGSNVLTNEDKDQAYKMPAKGLLDISFDNKDLRPITPCFTPQKPIERLTELKSFCDKLLVDQAEIRGKIKEQQVFINHLQNLKRVRHGLPKINKGPEKKTSIKESLKLDKDEIVIGRESHSVCSSKESDLFARSPKWQIAAREMDYSLEKGSYRERSNISGKRSPKYYKDQPKIMQTFRFPNEVFTPK
jgi:hypothetical protein